MANEDKLYKNKKKIERIAYISFGILVLFIVFVSYKIRQENKKFLKEGIRVEAIINGMSEYGTTKSRSYKMDISMFTQGELPPPVKTDTTGKSEGDKVIDAIFDKIKSQSRPIGNYVSATVSCNSDSYNKYKPGDKIKVVYLKEDSTDVRILEELE
ncbi:MAG: hypothetical protein U0U67_12545 [Chitinophagales bacterium]